MGEAIATFFCLNVQVTSQKKIRFVPVNYVSCLPWPIIFILSGLYLLSFVYGR
jgi:hypothetical protein